MPSLYGPQESELQGITRDYPFHARRRRPLVSDAYSRPIRYIYTSAVDSERRSYFLLHCVSSHNTGDLTHAVPSLHRDYGRLVLISRMISSSTRDVLSAAAPSA
jgi:hypothetical protein